MSTIQKRATMVRPAKETPKGTLWLSRLDMIIRAPFSHTRTLFIYHHTKSNKNDSTSASPSTFFDADILKESLRKTLDAFYPMAGRLRLNDSNGRYEIDCNAQGALFVEAETMHRLDEFKPDDEFRKLMAPECDYTKGLSSMPLLMAQLTRFGCGGVCLCIAHHHHVVDGVASAHFNNSWARLARGLDIAIMPVHDRFAYLAPRDPPQIKFQHLDFQPPLPPLPPRDLSGKVFDSIECVFKLSKDEIDALKQQVMCNETQNNSEKLSTFEILAGHVWQCACQARGLADDQDVSLYVPVNVRTRLKDPTLPQGYVGNALLFPICIVKAKDIMQGSLTHAAGKVHEMMEKMKDVDYLRSAIDYLESQPYLGPFVRDADTVTCPNFSINSWASIPLDEADFGWGKPSIVRHGGIKWEGQAVFVPSTDGDGDLSVTIRLFTPHVALFGRYLYAIENRVEGGELGISMKAQAKSKL